MSMDAECRMLQFTNGRFKSEMLTEVKRLQANIIVKVSKLTPNKLPKHQLDDIFLTYDRKLYLQYPEVTW